MDVEEEEDSDCHDDGDDDGSPRRESPTLLIVAHPDDEIMFFTPLLVSFKRLQILSLTAGSFPPSSGPVRCREMKCSCDIFLANGFMDLTILDDDRVRDGPIEGAWDGQERTIFRAINGAVEKLVKEYCTKKGAAPVSAINVVTFDDLGVSGHVNHRDTSRSVKDWYSKLKLAKGGRGGKIFTAQNFGKGAKLDPVSVKLYQLKSLKWWMKYSLTSFHPILTLPYWLCSPSSTSHPQSFLITCPSGVPRSLSGLLAHRSQALWYRFLFVFFSSYSTINVLNKVEHDEGKCKIDETKLPATSKFSTRQNIRSFSIVVAVLSILILNIIGKGTYVNAILAAAMLIEYTRWAGSELYKRNGPSVN